MLGRRELKMISGVCKATTNICFHCWAVKIEMAATGGMSLYLGLGRSLSCSMSYSILLALPLSNKESNRSSHYIKIRTGEVDNLT